MPLKDLATHYRLLVIGAIVVSSRRGADYHYAEWVIASVW